MEEPMDVERDREERQSPKQHGVDQEGNYVEHARRRKRTKRACDKCSTSRTRCDGERPCHRCKDYGFTCVYNRKIKKRGRTRKVSNLPSESPEASEGATPPLRRSNTQNGQSPAPALAAPGLSTNGAAQYPLPPLRHRRDDVPAATFRTWPTATHELGSPTRAGFSSAPIWGPHAAAGSVSYGTPGACAPQAHHLQLAPLLEDGAMDPPLVAGSYDSPPRGASRAAVSESEPSAGYGSPAGGMLGHGQQGAGAPARHSFSTAAPSAAGCAHERSSFSATTAPDAALPDMQRADSLYRAPSSDCRYRCLDPVLPYIRDIIPASVACDLLDVYLTEPGSSLFRCASPYILTRIFRKKSLLHPTNPRPVTPALLSTMLWCAAQTADIVLLHVPGSRAKITNDLYALSTSLISERDPDRWRRIHGGLRVESEQPENHCGFSSALPMTTATNEPAGVIDDVLTFILLSIAVSGGDFKSDCYKWWSKATRLALSLKLNREDERCPASLSPCVSPLCSCRRDAQGRGFLADVEAREERRRVFWLIYCLDRHLSLSFNTVIAIPDSYCAVYTPLPEAVWEDLDAIALAELPPRVLGPPATVSGTGFFEYFLPLMAILGDIIDVHHRRQHPRRGALDDNQAVAVVIELLTNCERSIQRLGHEAEMEDCRNGSLAVSCGPRIQDLISGINPASGSAPTAAPARANKDRSRLQLVTAYSTHILHVLHVLLHGKWDAISMLDDEDHWITTTRFTDCSMHAIAASQAVSRILEFDPELTFMPYLFGIYLLHGSFILLLFADRMPQLGPNQSVEQACETIIRAHEVCVVTLSTEFQKNFRKVLRSTLYSVRGSSPTDWEEYKARRRALSLYRWTPGAKGLGL